MPTCAHCGEHWSYMETFTAIWRMKPTCPYCKQRNCHSAKGRKRSMLFSVIFSPLFIIVGSLLTSLLWAIPLAIVVFIIICLIYPFTADISKEEEPLW